jgi:plastocyanin
MKRIRVLCFLVPALIGVLIVLSCGGGGGGYGGGPTAPTPPATGQVHIVQINDNSYDPQSITIQPGDTVRWVLNGNTTTHTVTAKNGSFDSGFIFTSKGMVYERRFDTKGTYEYSCQTHSVCCLMRGSVRVGNDAPDPEPTY